MVYICSYKRNNYEKLNFDFDVYPTISSFFSERWFESNGRKQYRLPTFG
jgi:hypothetical protein